MPRRHRRDSNASSSGSTDDTWDDPTYQQSPKAKRSRGDRSSDIESYDSDSSGDEAISGLSTNGDTSSEDEQPLSTLFGKWQDADVDYISDHEDDDDPDLDSFDPIEALGRNYTTLQAWSIVFPCNIIEMIVHQTNLYREQKNIKATSVTANELKKFVGILLYMSLVKMPRKSLYWRAATKQEIVATAMTRNRFFQILQMLHFADLSVMPAKESPLYDRFYRVRTLIDMVNEAFLNAARKQDAYQAVDEMMIKYKGRAPEGAKQYMPAKPTKWGYKMWARCGMSGYVYEFVPYQPKSPAVLPGTTRQQNLTAAMVQPLDERLSVEFGLTLPEVQACGATGQVVLNLAKSLVSMNPTPKLFFDNYFASMALLRCMEKLGIKVVSTVRANRLGAAEDRPPLRTQKELRAAGRGSYDAFVDNGIRVVQWFDNKPVLLASNFVGALPVLEVKRWDRRSRVYAQVPCPKVVSVYNRFMGGVDKADMLAALYEIYFRSKKFYTRIFYRVLDLSVSNAWILTKKRSTGSPLGLFDFKMQLAEDLIKSEAVDPQAQEDGESDDQLPGTSSPKPKKRESRRSVSRAMRFDMVGHFPVFSVKKSQTRCKHCAPGKTFWMCSKCQVHLCLTKDKNCFQQFHMQERF